MEDIDKTILELVNKINKTGREELNNIKVEESSTGRINMKIENGKKVYVVPKEYVYMVSLAVEEEKKRRTLEEKKQNRIFDDENAEMFGILNENSGQAKRAREKASKEKSNNYSSMKYKRNIKNSPKKMKRERLKANAKKCLKRILATLGIGAVLVAGGKFVVDTVNNYNDYKEVESTVEDLTESQIEEKAESILKEKISEATKVDEENISFASKMMDSSTYTATVKAGEDTYVYTKDYRNPIDFLKEDTLDGNIAKLISEIDSANGDRRKAINSLKNIQENDFKVDGKKLSIDKDKQTDDEKDER